MIALPRNRCTGHSPSCCGNDRKIDSPSPKGSDSLVPASAIVSPPRAASVRCHGASRGQPVAVRTLNRPRAIRTSRYVDPFATFSTTSCRNDQTHAAARAADTRRRTARKVIFTSRFI